VLARMYSPEDFGIFSAWLGIVLLTSIVLTGRFEAALAIEADGEARLNAVRGTLITALISTILLAPILGILYFVGAKFIGIYPILMALFLLPCAFSLALFQTWISWAASGGEYKKLTYLRVVQAAAINIIQISFGFLSPNSDCLASAYFLGVIVGVVFAYYLMPVSFAPLDRLPKIVLSFWRKHYHFPLFSLPADGVNTAASQLPVMLVAFRFGPDSAGLLAMAIKTLGAPVGLLGRSVLDVFKRQAALSYREHGECRSVYLQNFYVLSALSLGFFIVFNFIGVDLFQYAFGSKWRESGTIAVLLLPLFALAFIASPLSYMVYIAGMQRLDLLWQLLLLAVIVSCLLIPRNFENTLKAYCVGYSLMYLMYLLISYRLSLGIKFNGRHDFNEEVK